MPSTPGERARDAFAKAKDAAKPRIAKAQAEATPRVEKAAAKATTVFGQLKDRAKETAQGFTEGYKTDNEIVHDDPKARPAPAPTASDASRRRPRPGPGR